MSAAGIPGRAVLLGLGAAAGLWIGFPNGLASLPILVLAHPLLLAMLGAEAPDGMTAFRRGWLASWLGHVVVLHWLAVPVRMVGGLPAPLALACAACVAAGLSSAGGLFAAAARRLRDRPAPHQAAGLALAWWCLEWAHAVVAGFPWLPLSGALAAWPAMVQSAALVGACMTGALWLCAVLLLCPPGRSIRVRAAGAVLAAALAGHGIAVLAAHPLDDDPRGEGSFPAIFVEGNIDQNVKWTTAAQRHATEVHISLTREALRAHPGERPLIVWSETALPYDFDRFAMFSEHVRRLAADAGAPLLTGVPGFEGSGKDVRVYNRALLLGPDGGTLGHYDKEHLVPFGEYLPSWLDWELLAPLLQEVGAYAPGGGEPLPRCGDLAIGMLICYEGVFPWLAQARVEDGANVLADISNDAWFGDTPAARQHLLLTALRAVEQNRWILRGTNTGISAVIDARGRVTRRGPQFRRGWLHARARTVEERSVFHAVGPFLPAVVPPLCAALLILPLRRRREAGTA